MGFFDRIVNAVRRHDGSRPQSGVLVGRQAADLWREYPADGLTPQKLVAVMRAADAGDLSAQMALFEQMEERDAHLFSVANTRRLAVTGLPWEVVSAAEMPGWRGGAGAARGDRATADDAAAYCDEALREMCDFDEALAHLALAFGRNISVVELVWESGADGVRLAEMIPVEFERLTIGRDGKTRILTDDEKYDGIEMPPDKFIVHTPHARSGHPARGGLMRVTSLAYLAKRFAIKDWMIFAEVFGMPVRIARYAPNASETEKRELIAMLKQLGADATGIFSKAVEIEIMQTRLPGETNLYENLCLYFDREMSKAWLGQTLTTDTIRSRASAGAAVVHDRVRRDLRDDDLRREALTLRRDLLSPLTRLRFGVDAPVPHFRRVPDQTLEPERLVNLLSTAVNQLGARVPRRWAHAALGIPEAGEGESVVSGRET
jgi:phage gp29-like protein